METIMKVRRMILVDQQSIRSVSKATGISRNTIKKYLKDETPPNYTRSKPPVNHKIKGFENTLTQWYENDLARPKRERRTAQKLYEQLILEGYQGSYSPVCRFIKNIKQQSPDTNQAFIPLAFDPGDVMQFDWSMEIVVIGGIELKIKVAHFRLAHSRKPFIVAYPRETQEMLLDAFVKAFNFYQGVTNRVVIDNPKTMVVRIGHGKEREFHTRFMALMNHYAVEPVACTPASGWEKGQVENQVRVIRNQIFKPQLKFDDMAALNAHLLACSHSLGGKAHPQEKGKTIDAVFEVEQPILRPLGCDFDGYAEKTVKATSTCLAQFDSHHYSVPAHLAKQRLSLRAYADRILLVHDQQVVAEHPRSFNKHGYSFEPWHYVPVLKKKPGALRHGAPFKNWDLPVSLEAIKTIYLKRAGGDRDFVKVLLLIEEHSLDVISMACELALEAKTTQLSAIMNLVYRITEEEPLGQINTQDYPTLLVQPEANCQRYEQLRQGAYA